MIFTSDITSDMSTNLKQVKIYRKHPSSKKPILVVDDEFDIVNTIRLWLDRQFRSVWIYGPTISIRAFQRQL